jgi:hypothetical protein
MQPIENPALKKNACSLHFLRDFSFYFRQINLAMQDIETLPSTTISGRQFTRKQLTQVQETVAMFPNLSRKELALTLCEHLGWKNPAGKLKINSCLTLLEHLQNLGIVTLPEKRDHAKHVRRIPAFEKPPDESPIEGPLENIGPITLRQATSKADFEEFKAYIQTYHYLGYKHAFGSYIGYFAVSEEKQQKLGCLLFSASAAWAMAPRDEWIGWDKKLRQKLLHFIIKNDRFLLFPWVRVSNLASHVLSLATKQIGDAWVEKYGYRPVLIETFVDTTKYTGTAYRSANWIHLGQTQDRGFGDRKQLKKTVKEIFVYPLTPDWRHTLTSGHFAASLKKKYRNDVQASHTRSVDDSFVALWEKIARVINEVAEQYDKKWQVRQRLINSMLIILLVFRLVCSKNAQSYGTTIDELWDSCSRLNLPLPQEGSIAPSSFCEARRKLDEAAFKEINRKIIDTYSDQAKNESYKWLGHRIFAVDGSKINLPRGLLSCGYRRLSDSSYYPQGLLSSLYQVKSQTPFDFNLVAHMNERTCAEQHLQLLEKDDVVVYDRGYYSYFMLHRHFERKIHPVFRLQKNNSNAIDDFFAGAQTDSIVDIYPSLTTRKEIRAEYPDLNIISIPMRLIKYHINNEPICLGTTLLDRERYTTQDFIDIYHSRWGVEELYKVSKRIFIVEDFHAKDERGVKQEIYAHFALVTMNRIFANQADMHLNSPDSPLDQIETSSASGQPSSIQQLSGIKANFKNCIHVFTRSMEELILLHSRMKEAVERAFLFITGRYQKKRPGRSYPRKSMRPETKWHAPRKRKKKIKKDLNPMPMLNPENASAIS